MPEAKGAGVRAQLRAAAAPMIQAQNMAETVPDLNTWASNLADTGVKYLASTGNTTNYAASSLSAFTNR